MSEMKSPDAAYVRELVDLAVEELLTMPKDEFAKLVAESGTTVDALADAARSVDAQAIAIAGKEKLRCARQSLRTRREGAQIPTSLRDPQRARDYVRRLAASSSLMREKLTLAARSGTALSDRDVQSIIEDLASLGDLPDVEST